MEMLPHEVLTAFGKRDLGLEPADIDQIMVVAEVADGGRRSWQESYGLQNRTNSMDCCPNSRPN